MTESRILLIRRVFFSQELLRQWIVKAEAIRQYAERALEQNDNILVPFIRGKNDRKITYDKLNDLYLKQRNHSGFREWETYFQKTGDTLIANHQDLEETVRSLVSIVGTLKEAFYTEMGVKYQLAEFLDDPINPDNEARKAAEDYRSYLQDLVTKAGGAVGQLEARLSNN